MTTLAARVLEAIEAKVAAVNAWTHLNPDDGGYYSCRTTWGGPLGDIPAGPCDCGLDARREDALRRCAADRHMLGTYETVRESPEIHVDAFTVMKSVLRDLAEAYGVPLEQEET